MDDRLGDWNEDAVERFLLILSLLRLPPAELERRLPGRIPSGYSPYVFDAKLNPLGRLISVASTSFGSWYDKFGACEDLILRFARSTAGPHIGDLGLQEFSREGLYQGDWWNNMRVLAGQVILCAGLQPLEELPEKVDPSDFGEFPESLYDCDYEKLDPPFEPQRA